MSIAFVFPGQGSQSIGMGKALSDAFPAAKAVFDEVDEALGQKLSDVIWSGTEDELKLTANTQPALMAVSLAAVRALEAEGLFVKNIASYVAGHSLGEYSALAAAGSLSIADTARLLRIRGNAMQKAVPAGQGAMAALLGVDGEIAAKVSQEAAESEICQVANDNGGGQVVISGAVAAVTRALDIAKAHGAKRAILLPVSAPFHCALMQPAAEAMAEALANVTIHAPSVPVIANVTVAPVTTADEIRQRLVEQVTGMVRWRETIEWFAANGIEQTVEVGAGKVLSGLSPRIAKSIKTAAIGTPEDISAFKAALSL